MKLNKLFYPANSFCNWAIFTSEESGGGGGGVYCYTVHELGDSYFLTK
jgi:hypothetical protein